MPDDNPTPEAKPTVDDWKAPANQAELDTMIENRLARERKRYEGFEDFKTKASKFDEAQEASKTELDKATERATKAEAEAAKIRIEADRSSIALAKGLTPNQAKRLVGSTREEMEADADELLTDLAQGNKPSAPPKPPGGSGAARGGNDGDPDRQLARSLFGSH